MPAAVVVGIALHLPMDFTPQYKRSRDDFNRRLDVRSAVPLATGVVLSTNGSSLGINGKKCGTVPALRGVVRAPE